MWALEGQAVWARQTMELEQRLVDCATVVKDMMEAPDRGIPKDLLNRSSAVVVFPSLLKAGLGLGGHYGKGVILARNPKTGKWGPPAFFQMIGGSVGWQAGIQSTDLVVLVMNQVDLTSLFRDKFTLGADASVAAGPVGREASAGTDVSLQSGMLSYSRTKGIFAGVSIQGTILEPDWNANEAYYGSEASLIDVFFRGKGEITVAADDLMRLLNRYTARTKR
jgi:SH3 domain-containing YSC84-like protein 1